MATLSVIAAAEALYASLNPALFPNGQLPPLFFDRAVEVASNVEVQPPYVVLRDNGLSTNYDFEFYVIENSAFDFDVICNTLGDCDLCVNAIKYNGGPVIAPEPPAPYAPGQGFDFGVLSTLATNYNLLKIMRISEHRYLAGRNAAGGRTHACKLSYAVQVQRSS